MYGHEEVCGCICHCDVVLLCQVVRLCASLLCLCGEPSLANYIHHRGTEHSTETHKANWSLSINKPHSIIRVPYNFGYIGRASHRGGFLFLRKSTHETVIILDFGAQYTQLIARRVREAGVYCEILPFNAPAEEIHARNPKGLILSGGPSSVYDDSAPRLTHDLLSNGHAPILGICYGLQLIAHKLGGSVQPSSSREYGYARLQVVDPSSRLFTGLPQRNGRLDESRRSRHDGAGRFCRHRHNGRRN